MKVVRKSLMLEITLLLFVEDIRVSPHAYYRHHVVSVSRETGDFVELKLKSDDADENENPLSPLDWLTSFPSSFGSRWPRPHQLR